MSMFCFQCQQTIGNTGCTGKSGVCGKKETTANFQDDLTAALIGLARAVRQNKATSTSDELMMKGLFTTITNVSFNDISLNDMINEINIEKERIGRNFDNYDISKIWNDNEDVRSLKSLILFGLRGMAAYAYHAYVLGVTDQTIIDFFYEGMAALGENLSLEDLLSLVLKTGEINLRCMEILDKANTDAYGIPSPTNVPLTIEKGPFIVVSGHDLYDLKKLLEQTEGMGINIYTHSEMLPAHGYPKLKEYPHLKGNFGTAWQMQQTEFHNLPAPILFTTNCLMPIRKSYADRVFTTDVVSYPEQMHIGDDKDFTPIIEKALELGGYKEDRPMTGINGGSTVTTGFAHKTVLSQADNIINSVKQGEIRHFFLVGGCDGATPGRSYYTDFVKQTPNDTIIFTLACGKYRFNDLDLGHLAGFPRIMDMGQCNDAFSAIKVALALAEAFDCEVNELPLSLILSWFEQKAVAILLTLLYLGIKDIYLGPTVPAFISPNVLKILVDNYNITPISSPQEDLEKILG